jgi:hypothetical protein
MKPLSRYSHNRDAARGTNRNEHWKEWQKIQRARDATRGEKSYPDFAAHRIEFDGNRLVIKTNTDLPDLALINNRNPFHHDD